MRIGQRTFSGISLHCTIDIFGWIARTAFFPSFLSPLSKGFPLQKHSVNYVSKGHSLEIEKESNGLPSPHKKEGIEPDAMVHSKLSQTHWIDDGKRGWGMDDGDRGWGSSDVSLRLNRLDSAYRSIFSQTCSDWCEIRYGGWPWIISTQV